MRLADESRSWIYEAMSADVGLRSYLILIFMNDLIKSAIQESPSEGVHAEHPGKSISLGAICHEIEKTDISRTLEFGLVAWRCAPVHLVVVNPAGSGAGVDVAGPCVRITRVAWDIAPFAARL